MAKVPITLMGNKCDRCGHEWVPHKPTPEAKVCPKCKSPYWNKPRKQQAMTYEQFRDKIARVLKDAGNALTWTEIRTTAQLPQAFPNNQWVHRMETDIGLLRWKDGHGITHWGFKKE